MFFGWDERNRYNTNKTQIEMNTMLTTLLELELAGTVETLREEVNTLSTELDLTSYLFK